MVEMKFDTLIYDDKLFHSIVCFNYNFLRKLKLKCDIVCNLLFYINNTIKHEYMSQ